MRLFILVRIMILITMSPYLLGLTNFGSTATFNAIALVTRIGPYSSYLLPITFLILRQPSKKDIPCGPRSLGWYGQLSGLIAAMFFPSYFLCS